MNQGRMSLIDEDREFRHYYAQHLEPLEHRFESLRRKAVKERNRRIVAAIRHKLVPVFCVGETEAEREAEATSPPSHTTTSPAATPSSTSAKAWKSKDNGWKAADTKEK